MHMRTGRSSVPRRFQHAPTAQCQKDRSIAATGSHSCLASVRRRQLNRLAEAEKVLRQCLAFARNIAGAQSAIAAVALVPLADVLLKAGKMAEAAKIADNAYDALWKLGDPLFTETVGTRAEALKANGKADNPFADLTDLPEEMVARIAITHARQ